MYLWHPCLNNEKFSPLFHMLSKNILNIHKIWCSDSLVLVHPSRHLVTADGPIALGHKPRPHHRLEVELVQVVGGTSLRLVLVAYQKTELFISFYERIYISFTKFWFKYRWRWMTYTVGPVNPLPMGLGAWSDQWKGHIIS
jgi:hypothetical protein